MRNPKKLRSGLKMTGDGRFWRSFAKEAEFLKTLKMQLRNREDLLESNFGRWIQI